MAVLQWCKGIKKFFSQKKKIKIIGIDYIDEKNYLLNDANINFLSMNTNLKKKKNWLYFRFFNINIC